MLNSLKQTKGECQPEIQDSKYDVQSSMKSVCALKYLHNKKESTKHPSQAKFFDQYIAPTSWNDEMAGDGSLDIVLLHGNQSHAVKCWSVYNDKRNGYLPDIWINDYLIPDLQKYK